MSGGSDGRTYKRFSVVEIVARIDQLCDLLNTNDWPPNGEGVMFVQLWIATQLKQNGVSLDEAIAQFKGCWDTIDRMERGLPETDGGVH
ncbi:MAG TPA: hypothetical protein VIY48_11085 [Candidatus Paceibacterota bacterium]